jgi:exodeoxyribonuclease (lambda-induced)
MKLINVAQGTPEWLNARVGVITASRFADACDTLKNGDPSQKSIDYAYMVALERVFGAPVENTFVTYAMQRGTDLEPIARIEYETATGNLAQEGGIALTDDALFGYSTDGFVANDGLIEIKTPMSPRKICEIWANRDYSEYVHQIQGGLLITGRDWCDLVVYTPQLSAVGKPIFIQRIERDDVFIQSMQNKLFDFAKRVNQIEFALRG